MAAQKDSSRKRVTAPRAAAWTVGVALVALLVTSCAGKSSRGDDPESQALYGQEIIESRKEMFEGKISYTRVRSAKLGRAFEFHAEVAGFRVAGPRGEGKDLQRTGELQVGALMGVKLHCSGAGVTCTALSSERQNVLTPDDKAKWRWIVKPSATGTMALALTVTAYHRDTDNVLFEKPPFMQKAHVRATAAHTARRAKDDAVAVLAFLGAVFGLGVAWVTIHEFWQRRSGRKAEAEAAKKAPPRRVRHREGPRVRRRNRT
ncbi:hypothetical protein [Streptomyces sp. NPDC127108]|uniref:hypothetical protein n=1 Tax=Streptomyces sp. NPDC127108 TaxID=3345361 RepID=UPI00362AB222